MALLDTLLSTAVGIGSRAIHDLARRHYERSGRQASRATGQVQEEIASRVSQELERRQIPDVEQELGQRVRAELERRGLLGAGEPAQPEPVGAPPIMPEISPETMGIFSTLWSMAQGNEELFKTWASQYPNADVQATLQNPQAMKTVMMALGKQIQPDQASPEGIPASPIRSSNVRGFSYDRQNGDLTVQFHKGGIYRYHSVPKNIFDGFAEGVIAARTRGKNQFGEWWPGKKPSIGASHWGLIRDSFPYQKVA